MSYADAFLAIYRAVVAGLPPDWEVEIKSVAGVEPACRFRAYAVCNRTGESTVVYGATELAAITRLHDASSLATYLAPNPKAA